MLNRLSYPTKLLSQTYSNLLFRAKSFFLVLFYKKLAVLCSEKKEVKWKLLTTYNENSEIEGINDWGVITEEEERMFKEGREAEVAEWSKAVDLGSIPKGRGFKPHLLHFLTSIIINNIICIPSYPQCDWSKTMSFWKSKKKDPSQSDTLQIAPESHFFSKPCLFLPNFSLWYLHWSAPYNFNSPIRWSI